jgi:SNF2 family DNA or RNA helicase
VWIEEAAKWSHTKHLSIVPIMGTEKERLQALKYDAEIFTTNYEQLPWLVEHFQDRWPYRTVVADESDCVKSFRLRQGGKQTAALGKVAHKHVKRFMELTGTPSPNGLQDLWGQIWYLDRGNRLGRTFEAYKQRWFRASPDGYGSVAMPHAQAEIQELLRDVCLTIDSKDYFDLKEPIVRNVEVDLPPKVRQLYKEMEKEYFMTLECGTEIEAFSAAARSGKLLQCASGAIYLNQEVTDDSHPKAKEWKYLHDEKLDALDEIISENNGSPVMVSYQFQSELTRLRKRYPNGKWLSDPKEMAEFKTGKFTVGFGQPASVARGTDGLQEHCNTMVLLTPTWNLSHHEQMLARVGPMRQFQSKTGKNVFIYNLLARGTIDEDVAERIVTKATVQNTLLAAMKRRRTTG